MKKGEQVKEALGCLLVADMVHAVKISPQAAEDMLSRMSGFRDCRRVKQGEPDSGISRALQMFQGLLFSTPKKAQQPQPLGKSVKCFTTPSALVLNTTKTFPLPPLLFEHPLLLCP